MQEGTMFSTFEEFLHWIENQRRFSPKVSLEKMRSLCEVLGNPQENLQYIHIGGTNGKGSTVSFVSNILREAGYNVGAFISPYVIEFNERISYNGMYISNADVLEVANRIHAFYPTFTELNLELPTFFEFLTLMAFCYFDKIEELDIVVMEVGLGGLLDSTNIITPLVSAITNISYDHMKVLGDTLEDIAKNKLGIAKATVPMVTIKQDEVKDIFIEECQKKKAPLYFVEKADISHVVMTLKNTIFDYKDLVHIQIKLLGLHQTENAALAIEIVRHLPKKYEITNAHILQGLHATFWPGRLELVSTTPVVLLDGAHNIGGITRLAEFLNFLQQTYTIKLIFAVSQDKEKNQMIDKIEHFAEEIIFSSFHYKRSDDPTFLYSLSHHPNKRIEEDLDTIFHEIKEDKENAKIAYVFCGSLYFISEVRTHFVKNNISL